MTKVSRKKRPINRIEHPLRDTRLIVIATEGRETEKQYFNIFHSRRVQILILPTGEDNASAPQHVIERLNNYNKDHSFEKNDGLWLMIDVDRWLDQTLSEVAQEARTKKYKLAVSNPCFEIWLLCHRQSPPKDSLNCTEIKGILKNSLGGSYNSANLDLDAFKDRVDDAIEIAERTDPSPASRWPIGTGTHVYRLVQSIRAAHGVK
ncbi:MAG: hypothetical protein HW380_196 [Magnetococcales bacterium]|nr:hypothetical protein [Magnetococcales bacterium]HIJ84107.1 RloB domain-containing protein [Magnetococcales bacterium]